MNIKTISGIIILMFLIACTPNVQKEEFCNKPYIKIGNECCLDQNDNLIKS